MIRLRNREVHAMSVLGGRGKYGSAYYSDPGASLHLCCGFRELQHLKNTVLIHFEGFLLPLEILSPGGHTFMVGGFQKVCVVIS